jgi:hypothetical protein
MRIDEQTDVVYPVKLTRNGNRELRLSLRSLSNIPHRNVYVVAPERPEWLSDDVRFIECPDDHSPYENVNRKLLAACSVDDLSDNFVYMNDDIFIMQKMTEIPYWALSSTLQDRLDEYKVTGMGIYAQDLLKTKQFLEEYRQSTIDFESHSPIVFHKGILEQMLTQNIRLGHRHTLYGNLTFQNPVYLEKDFKLYFTDGKIDENQPIISTIEEAFTRNCAVSRYLENKFANKSIYEVE